MNILHITTIGEQAILDGQDREDDLGGGIGRSLINFINYAVKANIHKYFVSTCIDGLFSDQARRDGIDVKIVNAKWIKFIGRPLFVYLSISDLIKIIKHNKIDIIHAHNFAAGFSAGIASKITGVPMILSVHQDISEYVTASSNKIRKLLSILRGQTSMFVYKIAVMLSIKILCVSRFVKNSLSENGFNSKKVSVFYNGINIDGFEKTPEGVGSFRNKLGIKEGEIVVASVGRLHPVKGYEYFIKAAKEVLGKSADVKFVLIGEGEEQNELEFLAKELKIEKNFIFAGHRNNILDVLQEIDIFVLSSLSEGCPTVILEAMIIKKPIIATKVGGVPEIIEHKNTGLLVESKNSEELAKAILSLINDKELREKIAINGYEHVKEQFSLKKRFENLEEIYREVIKN